MDATDMLTSTLKNLQIFQNLASESTALDVSRPDSSISTPEIPSTFPLYPSLPFELRLKILSHTLPQPRLYPLRLNAHVLISDPSFGLYITFSISCFGYVQVRGSFQSPPEPGELAAELKTTRMVPLLGATKETREFYLSRHAVDIPSGPNGKGKIRVGRWEWVYIDNFPTLLANREFSRAVVRDYRLQDFWARIENLATPVVSFMGSARDSRCILVEVVRKCTWLKRLGAVMWEGFRNVEGGEIAARSVLAGIEGYLAEFKKSLKKEYDADSGQGESRWRMPVLQILES